MQIYLTKYRTSLGRACFLEVDADQSGHIDSVLADVTDYPDKVEAVYMWSPAENFSSDVTKEVAQVWWERNQRTFDKRIDVLPYIVHQHLDYHDLDLERN